jgi:hypothetical protein
LLAEEVPIFSPWQVFPDMVLITPFLQLFLKLDIDFDIRALLIEVCARRKSMHAAIKFKHFLQVSPGGTRMDFPDYVQCSC